MQTRRYGHMLHEYYVRRLREIAARRRQRLDALSTRADAAAYVRTVGRAVRKSFGPMPLRSPLSPRVAGRDRYDGYTLERVAFESRPGLVVTGNMLLPGGPAGRKLPCVLGLCGHSANGKAYEAYQSFAQGLAVKGFAVFIIDPIAQGERNQFYPSERGAIADCCHVHNLLGNQMTLTGDFFGAWRVWDAIRALDYLLSRPEVDRTRVGVTGCSGGGTLTTYLAAMDDRPTMVAPVCYVTSWLANLENELPADSEQNPPGALAAGLDEADLLLVHAPRPTLIVASQDDFFDERFSRQAADDLRRVHRLLGSRNSADCFVADGGHGYSRQAREAVYGFFLRHAGMKGRAEETGVAPVPDARLHVMPEGRMLPADSKRVFDFLSCAARGLAARRRSPSAAKVKAAAGRLLGVGAERCPPHYRSLYGYWGWSKDPQMRRQFGIETDPGIQAVATTYGPSHGLMRPPRGDVVLYVGHIDAHADVCDVPEVREAARGPAALVAVDPRGIGQTMPQTCGHEDFFHPYGSDFLYAGTADMLGESLLGGRVRDVLRTLDWLLANGARPRLLGRGLGSITAAFAALLHPSRPKVRLLHYLPSYHLLTQQSVMNWPLSALLRDVLRHFDLPDVYRALGGRLALSHPWDHRMQ